MSSLPHPSGTHQLISIMIVSVLDLQPAHLPQLHSSSLMISLDRLEDHGADCEEEQRRQQLAKQVVPRILMPVHECHAM